MTQEDLAQKAGMKRTDVNALVKGRRRLGQTNAPRVAKALGLPPDYFDSQQSSDLERLRERAEVLLDEAQSLKAAIDQAVGK